MPSRVWLTIVFLSAAVSFSASAETVAKGKYQGKRILHIDSYDQNYRWSADIRKGITSVLDGTGVLYRIEEMDSKRHPDEESKKAAAKRIKGAVEKFKPDVIIATDDNASKYIVQPFFKDSKIPVVFSGINWDVKKYGYPYKNTTGMEEVSMVGQMYAMLKSYAKMPGVGIIAGDDESSRVDNDHDNSFFLEGKAKIIYCANFEEFKKKFLELQKEVGLIFFGSMGSIKDWDLIDAEEFLAANTKIPTGSHDVYTNRISVVTYAKYGEEQGEWPARAALRILDGTAPSAIPVVRNKRVKLFINQPMAKKVGIHFPNDLLKLATVLEN
jgi:ABC-type uncharacterized transport system substrate-binding protein